MWQHRAIVPHVQVPCINQAVQRCALVPVNMRSSGNWTLDYSEQRHGLWRESPGSEKHYPRRCSPYCTVSEFVLSEVLGHVVCLLSRRLMCCQAAIPCLFESTSLTLIFLRSHLSCYQLGSNLVDQWKLWRCTDLFFSGIDKPVLQDPQLRLRVWLTEGCEISKGDKEKKSKKAKNHSPLCCNSECNQSQTIILSLDTQIHFSWAHRKSLLYIYQLDVWPEG